jgi:GNAT superfamily N-acetyltransferase
MSPESTEIADDYWARELGCARTELRPGAPRVRAHAGGLTGYNGSFVLVLDAAPLVSVPPEILPIVAARADQFAPASVADAGALRRLLSPSNVTRVIGPAYIHYADPSSLGRVPPGDARALTPLDAGPFRDLRAACAPEDWDPKDFALEPQCTFAAFDADGSLAAVANFRIWDGGIAHISVIAHPERRGRGHATRAVAATMEAAVRAGLVPQYRVLAENAASLRVAEKLGFRRYGWSVAARHG